MHTCFNNVSLLLFLAWSLIVSVSLSAQDTYTTNGSASDLGAGCYQLTPAANGEVGSAWNDSQIDLSCNFLWEGTFNVGTEGGADGMAFVFHNATTGLATPGNNSLTGFGGITPSIAIELDSYENNSDGLGDADDTNPSAPNSGCTVAGMTDHVALYEDGIASNYLVPPMCVTTFADGADHMLIISWDSVTLTLNVQIDGVTVITYSDDIVTNVFGGTNFVYIGFTSRTGGLNNAHSFCQDNIVTCCSLSKGFVD